MRRISFITLVFGMLFAGCSTRPSVSLSFRQQGDNVFLRFNMKGVNGLIGLQIWEAEEREMLWGVNLNYLRAEELRYGEVPITVDGVGNRATQNFPSKGQSPKRLPPSREFFIALDCQYDSFLAASSQTFYFSFKTDKMGNVTQPIPISAIASEKFPKAFE